MTNVGAQVRATESARSRQPVDPRRLASALARIKRSGSPRPQEPGAALEQLFVRDGPRCWFVPLCEVRHLTSEGNYVRMSWGTVRPLVGRALSAVEQRLDAKKFFRANRRQITNLEFVESVELATNGCLHMLLRDGPNVEIPRRQPRLSKVSTGI